MAERILYNVYSKERKSQKGFSIVIALSILMIAIVFMLFGFKIYVNNLYHNETNVIYDSLEDIREYNSEIVLVNDNLNMISTLRDKMQGNFYINELPMYSIEYYKNRNIFRLYLYTDEGTKIMDLNYKFTNLCTCDKIDCYYKLERILIF